MRVALINWTNDAEALLLFTKDTRLSMAPTRLQEIREWSDEFKKQQLAYMANTIPSSWEFVDYVFVIESVTRAFTHQLVRNRHGSYAQQSMRVTDQGQFTYVAGPSIKNNEKASNLYNEVMVMIAATYEKLQQFGADIEDARGVLPTNICTNIVVKYNLRTMAELARSRTGGRTQDEYRAVFRTMCDLVIKVHPWAEQFLFPKGKGYFDGIEEAARKITDKTQRQEILKAIDKMRKS